MASDVTAEIEQLIPRLRAYARVMTKDHDRADDLVQTCLERALRSLNQFTVGTNLRAWLFTISRNLAIDEWRRQAARLGEVVTDDVPEPPSEVDEAERAVEAWTIAEALSKLSQAHREVLIECFYQGRSVAEAAARLGIPPGTVKSRTHYALQSLRLILSEMGVIR